MSRAPTCPQCRERLSSVEAGMIGVWTCVYCEGAWLARSNARELFAGCQDETVVSSADAPVAAALTCPGCERRSMRSQHLGNNELFACDCGSAYLPKPTVAAFCHELGGRLWQLGELLFVESGRAVRNADVAVTAGALIALLFLS